MNRTQDLQRLQKETFDICIIGGGASGAGCALDAALRGFKVALIEKNDFAAETSSKSTKLIHGGVRYLEQAFKNLDFAQLKQVRHGLEERQIVLQNAPHLARPLPLLTPVFSWWEGLYFSIGLRMYDFFAKGDSLPKSRWLSKKETMLRMPSLDAKKLHSAVLYFDGQLDDARYCLGLAHAAAEAGVAVANHLQLIDFEKDNSGKLEGAVVSSTLDNGVEPPFSIKAKLFINCTGAMADHIRLKANPTLSRRIRPSKGVHVVLPYEVLKSDDAMLIPKTSDGRVVFAIPFEGQLLLGTTDTDYTQLENEPLLEEKEVEFLLDTLAPYLAKRPDKSQVKAGFGGLRPLLAASESDSTKKLVRDHEVEYDESSNLLSLLGGKWTTYRYMAKETIDKAGELLGVERPCLTADHVLVGGEDFAFEDWKIIQTVYRLAKDIAKHLIRKYGSRAHKVARLTQENIVWSQRLVEKFPFIQAEVIYQVREEMACTLRDVLARRMRLEIMDWEATQEAVPVVANLMAQELGWTQAHKQKQIDEYLQLVQSFIKSAE
ncbi:glycerol-3-phosphate dehydrogenase/oxidase [Runella salmonicolor]|uniref:Glycerol-3-phosphate dehydrogenase n=1 Tax=Runella salmonicolor TaxID=2950278 RepID=A0ABT1FN04_9BACT|nr:FAD-dependent oxidoreductase [Runella salmonicolor]MCP1382168.1 FAD-dependent oxidoreductase [Runella salmonicolor]